MRKDIMERMKYLKKEGLKPNYSQVARRYNCDYRTVKRYFEEPEEKRTKKELICVIFVLIRYKYTNIKQIYK